MRMKKKMESDKGKRSGQIIKGNMGKNISFFDKLEWLVGEALGIECHRWFKAKNQMLLG